MAWPPPSLANTNVEALVNDLEDEEVSGMRMRARPFATLVQMTALLYLGDYVAVGMLWKRSYDSDALLQEWINVVATPMMTGDSTRAIEGLQHLSSTSPLPFSQYAAEIAQMYLQRNENKRFAANNQSNATIPSVAPVVAFLESAQWTA
jgi:hypothetical protein